MKIRIRKLYVDEILFFIIIFFAILTANTLYFMSNFNMILILSSAAVLFTTVFFIFNIKISNPAVCMSICYEFIMMAYVLLRGRESMMSILILLMYIPMFFLIFSYLHQRNLKIKFFKMFIVICTVIACISLFFWIFGSVLNIIQPTNKYLYIWGGSNKFIPSYYNIYFQPQGNNIVVGNLLITIKNCAFFAEAPMANFVFSTALLLNVFIVKFKPKLINTILMLTILSTQSTTGMIVLIMLAVSFIMNKKAKTQLAKISKFCFVVLLIFSACSVILYLVSEKMMQGSGVARSTMIQLEFEAFLQSPIIGNGFNKFTNGSSNSITALLADGGLLIWGIYYSPMIGVLLYDLIKKSKINYFVLIFMFVFAITAVQYTMLMTMITVYLWYELFERFHIVKKKKSILASIRRYYDFSNYSNL